MSKVAGRTDWAEEEDDALDLPAPQVIKNKDGSETVISYRINEQGQKVKCTRRIRQKTIRTVVNPRVAERKTWAKFGEEKGKATGPQTDTTSVGENIVFRPMINWKASQKQEEDPMEQKKATLKDTKIKCRICSGEHWTSKCPFKDTMAPDGDPEAVGALGGPAGDTAPAAAGNGGLGQKGSYVPPHLRGKEGVTGERMGGGKYTDRDDLATLRVTNVSEWAEEQDLRDMFSRFGHVQRVFLAKDRETGRAKGFAFISFSDRTDAAKACEKMDGYGYNNLILRVEFAKKSTD